ncbi:MAG: PIN domain-containing protein [Verrucomicrobia bacterium]|nr:PIN domain-containing protein [Verrucomicrobiota bacterium]
MAILVDTGALELLRRRERRAETLALRHFPPVIALHSVAEFLFGLENVQASRHALQEARKFLDEFEILCPTESTAAHYAQIRAQLAAGGIRLPDPDYWIAAHAMEKRLPLLSTDRDFRHIPDLTCFFVPARTID